MYHLLVTAEDEAWEKDGSYQYPLSRFLEYTDEVIAESFRKLPDLNHTTLLSLPCVFAYEGNDRDVRIGKLLAVQRTSRQRSVDIQFQLDPNIPSISFDKIKPIQKELDIRGWEMNRTHWAIKDVDLFGILRKHNVPIHITTGTAQGSSRTAKQLPLPAPPQLSVSSLHEFVSVILDTQVDANEELFYRGHADQTYKLEPSLFRRDKKGNYLYRGCEDVLYRELLVSNSFDFQGDNYTLDRLVRMQHFSLPTRLLDITSNPLIALFFACRSYNATNEGHPEVPGEVIAFTIPRQRIKYFDSDTASCIANLARLSATDKDSIYFGLEQEAFNTQGPMRRLLHFVKEEKSYFEPRIKGDDLRSIICVKGKRSNSRISFQSGAFLLFGHEAILDEQGTSEIQVKRITIKEKPGMLRQLDRMNINESTVFPYIENSARYIADKFKFRQAETEFEIAI